MTSTATEVLTVAEVYRRYPDEWVLMEITHDDKDTLRVCGYVLGHSPDRPDLDEPFERLRAERPHARTLEFYAGEVAPEGVVVVL